MKSLILSSLYAESREQFAEHLYERYTTKGHAFVNFLYFSNAMHYRLFEKARNDVDMQYKEALLSGDFLLPDGIALQIYTRFSQRLWVSNLNGTDLTPFLLDYFVKKYSVSLYVSSVYDENIGKDTSRLQKGLSEMSRQYPSIRVAASHQCDYAERGEDFPWEQFSRIAEQDDADIKIFLHCTGTPYQELWTESYRDWLADHGMMVLNVGGLLDFYSGFEKRAPEWAVKARVLETFYRIFSSPRKNLKKFWRMFGIVRLRYNSITRFFSGGRKG